VFLRPRCHCILKLIRSFLWSETGMTLPLLAFAMVMITGLTGLAIDIGRMQLVQSRLQFALDAAALAAGSTVSTTDLTTEANKYLNANFNGYLGASLNNVLATADSTITQINLSATATLPTSFMQVFNVQSMAVTANSQVTRQLAGLEVTVVIDVSYGDDLTDFKNGLANFIQTLFTSAAGVSDNLYVAVVPFNQAVNIGTWNSSWISPTSNATILAANPAGWGPVGNPNSVWGGCVDARSGSEALVDDPPSSGNTLFNENYYPSDTAASIQSKLGISSSQANQDFTQYANWPSLNNMQQTVPITSSAFAQDFGLNIWQGVVNISGSQTQYYTSPLDTVHQGPNFMCPPPIVPLTNNETSILNTINGISVIQGDWLPDQGLEWAWNTLSPRWQGLWGGVTNTNGLPLKYNTPGWNKAIVWVEGYANASITNIIDNHIRGAYGYLQDGTLGTTDQNTAFNTIYNRTTQVCNSIKANNVYVYLLGYSANNSESGLPGFMQGCATATNYAFWFGPGNWTAFNTALNAIADSLVNLRVSK
jgi:Flp pilus assembly protein TadG